MHTTFYFLVDLDLNIDWDHGGNVHKLDYLKNVLMTSLESKYYAILDESNWITLEAVVRQDGYVVNFDDTRESGYIRKLIYLPMGERFQQVLSWAWCDTAASMGMQERIQDAPGVKAMESVLMNEIPNQLADRYRGIAAQVALDGTLGGLEDPSGLARRYGLLVDASRGVRPFCSTLVEPYLMYPAFDLRDEPDDELQPGQGIILVDVHV